MVVVLAGAFPTHAQSVGEARVRPPSHSQLRAPTGAERCQFCHPAEVQGYSRSAMAHALRRAGQEPDGVVTGNGTKITMHSSPTGYWQSWENGGDKSTYRVDYVIGSGEHASGYLINIGGHLFQSPVAFYKSRQSYDLAPGYENQPDPDFTRPVGEECVLCHSGIALHVPGTLNQYRAPAFAAEGITCERCHGPSEAHLTDPRAETIVNPSKLSPATRDSICEQCHLFGVARVPNPGKKLSDFVPGEPLENTYTIYRNVHPTGSSGDFKVISHVEQLAQSSCARNSAGRLWCATCHNPHEKMPRSVEYYRSRCLSCHMTDFPNAHPSKASDCLGCHMPRRDAKDGGHTAFTDHRIQRHPETPREVPENAVAIAAWREPAKELRQRNLGIAHVDVGMQRHSSTFIIQGYRELTEVQGQFRGDADFFKWIGEALLLGKQTSDAKLALERALTLDPDSALTEASAASPYIQEGDNARAIAHLERAVGLDPLFLPAASTLIGLYEKEGEAGKATELSAKIKTAMTEDSDEETAQRKSAAQGMKNTEEAFKNIQVLKGIPAEQLIPSMQFMSSSLGVECTFCHVEGHFEKDDKKPKQRARDMMHMMFEVNENSFDGLREVTCNSCHRGSRDPLSTPIAAGGSEASTRASGSGATNLSMSMPTAGRLIDKYTQALGGTTAIQKVTSRVETGVAQVSGKSLRVEIFTQDPDKWEMIRHAPEGDDVSVFDGQAGWVSLAGRAAHQMHQGDIEAARLAADLQFPLHMQRVCADLRVEYPETIGDHQAYVLSCMRDGRTAVKLHFDEESGLLVRAIILTESALGVNPSRIDYGDYREVAGVKVPYSLTFTEPGTSYTVQIEEVRQNVPLPADKFARPSFATPK